MDPAALLGEINLQRWDLVTYSKLIHTNYFKTSEVYFRRNKETKLACLKQSSGMLPQLIIPHIRSRLLLTDQDEQ